MGGLESSRLFARLGFLLFDAPHFPQRDGYLAGKHASQVALNDDGGASPLQELDALLPAAEGVLQHSGGVLRAQEALPLTVALPVGLHEGRSVLHHHDPGSFERLVHR